MENQVGKSHDVIKHLRFLAEELSVDEGQRVKAHDHVHGVHEGGMHGLADIKGSQCMG